MTVSRAGGGAVATVLSGEEAEEAKCECVIV
jgi:hypothetical protein